MHCQFKNCFKTDIDVCASCSNYVCYDHYIEHAVEYNCLCCDAKDCDEDFTKYVMENNFTYCQKHFEVYEGLNNCTWRKKCLTEKCTLIPDERNETCSFCFRKNSGKKEEGIPKPVYLSMKDMALSLLKKKRDTENREYSEYKEKCQELKDLYEALRTENGIEILDGKIWVAMTRKFEGKFIYRLEKEYGICIYTNDVGCRVRIEI